jgi:5-methylcytosine-specific restriction endonuclease McrA
VRRSHWRNEGSHHKDGDHLGNAATVDHVLSRVLGGTHDPDNLRPCCASCNYSTGAGLGNRLRPPRSLNAAQRQVVALKRRQVDPNDYRTWRGSR